MPGPFESGFTTSVRELGAEVFVTPMATDPVWRSIQVAMEIVRTRGVDVIHAHLPKGAVLAGLVGRLTHTPCVATVHERYASDQMLSVARITGAHLLTVCQEAYFHALSQGIPTEQLSLIPNGVDVDVFTPNPVCGAAFRQALGVPAEAPLVGCVARLSPEKGLDRFVRAAEQIHRLRPDVHFAVIGEGYQHQRLIQLSQSLGLETVMHIPGRSMDTTAVYPALDVVVQTSRSEGMPLVLLEAMACARPVVAMRVGGVAEIVEAGSTGVLVERNDWQALAGGVVELLADPVRRQAMGDAGRRRVCERFQLAASVERTGELLCQLGARATETTSQSATPLEGPRSRPGLSVNPPGPAAPSVVGARLR